MQEKRKHNAQQDYQTRQRRADREHEKYLKLLELMEKDPELKYYLVILLGTGGIAAVNYLSGLQTAHMVEKALGEMSPIISYNDWEKGVSEDIKKSPMWRIGALGPAMYKKEVVLPYLNTVAGIKGKNYQVWDEILGGVFGASVAVAGAALVLKIMWSEGPPPGVGSVTECLALAGVAAIGGGVYGAALG